MLSKTKPDKKILSKIQEKISVDSANSELLHDYMKENGLKSIIDINILDFQKWYSKSFDISSKSICLTNNNRENIIHINLGVSKNNKEEYSSFSLCDKKSNFYGTSTKDLTENQIKAFLEIEKTRNEDYVICEKCEELLKKHIKKD